MLTMYNTTFLTRCPLRAFVDLPAVRVSSQGGLFMGLGLFLLVLLENYFRRNAPDSPLRPSALLDQLTSFCQHCCEVLGTAFARLTDIWYVLREYFLQDFCTLLRSLAELMMSPFYLVKGYIDYWLLWYGVNAVLGGVISSVVVCVLTAVGIGAVLGQSPRAVLQLLQEALRGVLGTALVMWSALSPDMRICLLVIGVGMFLLWIVMGYSCLEQRHKTLTTPRKESPVRRNGPMPEWHGPYTDTRARSNKP